MTQLGDDDQILVCPVCDNYSIVYDSEAGRQKALDMMARHLETCE